MSAFQRLWILAVFGFGCSNPPPMPSSQNVDSGAPDGGDVMPEVDAGALQDAGLTQALALQWSKGAGTPPSRSNHVSFFWPPAHKTFVFSGNHVTGPIHDGWSWDGQRWQAHALTATEYPDRKNAGLAVDLDGGQAFVFGGTWSGSPPDGGSYLVRVLGDTQRWDGTSWKELNVTMAPSARGGAAMTWDAARQKAVLFGGSDNTSAFSDTWLFDGTTWTQVASGAPHPSARLNSRMAYDPVRQRVVLFSGQAAAPDGSLENISDTWEWDGLAWHDVTSLGPQPAGRGHHSLQWDPSRQKVMLIGGARHFAPLPPGSTLDDQWEWDGRTWSSVVPLGPRPGPRTATSLAYDSDRNVMVLFGGFNEYDLNDQWEWNGQRWTERSLQPLPRSDFAFAQTRPGEAVMFGGYLAGGGMYLNDTYRFAQGNWVRVTGTAPPVRSAASLALHDGVALLLGGVGKQGTVTVLRSDAWTLKRGESDWRPITGRLPPGRRLAAMAYDPSRALTVLFGGRGPTNAMGDTWVWDGTSWTERRPTSSPSPRFAAKLLFNPARRQLVLLGGMAQDRTLLNEAWAFDGENWSRIEGLEAAPTPRVYAAHVFDSGGRLVTWGGQSGTRAILGDLGVREATGWTSVMNGPTPRFDGQLLDLGDRWRTLFGSNTDFTVWWEDASDVWELGPRPLP